MKGRGVVITTVLVGGIIAGILMFTGPVAAQTIDIEHTLQETSTDGEVDVHTQLQIPSGTTSLEVTVPEEADVYETNGFSQSNDRTYRWSRTTNEPYLRYDYAGNVTINRGSGDQYLFVVSDEWALIRTPSVRLQWTGVQADVSRSSRIDGEGVAGDHISYLGSYNAVNRDAERQRFSLIIPAAADLRENPGDILDTLQYASDRLPLGNPDPEVHIIAAPSAAVDWAATGVQRGDSDLWVRDIERLDDARNTWIHEYSHTFQDYDRTESTRWTIEGMAEYYAALLSYERGLIDYEQFQNRMAQGRTDRVSDVELINPDTWQANEGNYHKGTLVLGHLDHRLRLDADSSLDAVIREVNEPETDLTHERFLDAVENAGGDDIRRAAERYTETTETPELWDRQQHAAAFGGPDFRYDFASYAVSGPFRETDLEQPMVVTGETLAVTVRVRNVGDREGEFTADFRVADNHVRRASETVGANEAITMTFTYPFETAGEYTMEFGTATATATVEDPAGITVTDIETEPTNAAIGETVTIRATVALTGNGPAEGDVTFTQNGEAITTRHLRINQETSTVETSATFDAAGEHTVAANDKTTTVTVRDETVVPTPTSGDDAARGTPTYSDGSGLGPQIVIIAFMFAIIAWRR